MASKLNAFFVNFFLLVLSVLLFALPQPNLISLHGFPFLAYIAFVPLFLLVRRISFKSSFVWGGMYGLLSYCLFTYWLGVFHPLAMYVIGILYFFWLLCIIPLLKLADSAFPKRGDILQWVIWIGYEYVKTLGFNGYSYGIIGYSQWTLPSVIGIASIFGVWGVSALVVFPSAWIAGAFKDGCAGPVKTWGTGVRSFAARNYGYAIAWGVCFCAALVYGTVKQQDWTAKDSVPIALIQPNSDPWMGGIAAYKKDFETLTRLSDQALEAHPETALVVWPETAFIPRIDWHYRYREDRESWELVSRLLQYLDSAPVPFVLGNDDAVMGPLESGDLGRLDYNAVFLFRPGENVNPPRPERYRKMHLVPFTEHFPYRKWLPWVYDLLIANDTHFWEKGSDPAVFSAAGLVFSTPICFEDTFGYISRRFVRSGARAIVNLTNDAWAKSLPCQYQHLSMAVFRAVENRVPLVRSTASGQTCFVDPDGRVTAMAPPSEPAYLAGRIPLVSDYSPTLYTRWGDVWGIAFFAVSCMGLIAAVLTKLRKVYEN